VQEILYLGAVISCDGKNSKNIVHKQNRALGTQKQIMSMVKGLGKYTIECGFIYLNSLLRGSILYAAEAMINISEQDFRHIEQIEEDLMRKLFSTDRSCPLHLMYLEAGQVPARFQIKRMILVFFQYILKQKEESMLFRMLQAQVSSPIKNDFYETATNILSEFDICYSMKEIKDMKIGVFKSIVKKKCIKTSFEYLVKKQMAGRKGKYIKYLRLTIADYLLPEADMSLEDQQELFSIRCRTNPMGANRGKIEYCFTQCGDISNNSHILLCKVMNKSEDK
jgi:hypothetical protein